MISLYIMSAFYLLAGVNHFINPKWYLRIIPKWLPNHSAINYLSGAAEIILAILLLPLPTRSAAAWGIIVLLVAIFPANIQMSLTYKKYMHPRFWLTVLRLPLQVLFIWWAFQFTS